MYYLLFKINNEVSDYKVLLINIWVMVYSMVVFDYVLNLKNNCILLVF